MKKVLVMVLAAAFMLAMYVPASAGTAADWDLYGQARLNTFWTDYSDERGKNADQTTLNHTLQGNSRIGGTVQQGAIGGGFEFGVGSSNVSTRQLFGTVDLGQGQLKIGQDYAPYGAGSFLSTQCGSAPTDDNFLQFVGYTSRLPMVQYSVDNFKIALVEPQVDDLTTGASSTNDGNPEVQLPQLQASYDLMMQGVDINLAGVFQTYELQSNTADWDGESLNAWGLAANMKFNQLDPFYFNLGGFYGQNVGNFGQSYTSSFQENDNAGDSRNYDAFAVLDGDSIEDTNTFGLLAVLGTDIDNIGLQAGVGYLESDNDEWEEKDKMVGYYGQATIPLTADGKAFIRPEVGYYDYYKNPMDEDRGDELYAGMKWQVNF